MNRDDVFNSLMRKYKDMSWQDLHKSQYVLVTRGLYWRPNSQGYGYIYEAGLYDFDFACRVVCDQRDAHDEMIPIQKLEDELIDILQGAARLMVAVRQAKL